MINTEKTRAILFHTEQNRLPFRPQVTFKNTNMAHTTEVRFLGICITDNLKLDTQARLLNPILIKVSCIIKSLQEVMGPYMICTLYKNFQPFLRYGIIFRVAIIKVITY